MMTIDDLNEYSKRLGYNRGQIEKDYLQYHVLFRLSRKSGNTLVFKGGTCLQKVFNLDRFSEDLDFTLNNDEDEGPDLEDTRAHLITIGYPTEIRPATRKGGKGSFRLLIEGPLFDGGQISKCSITVNISQRDDLIAEPIAKRLVPFYAEVPPFITYHMEVEEMMAEKIRALMTREKARDLYDLHFLLKKGIRPNRLMVDSKLAFYETRLTKTGLREAIISKKRIWERELTSLLSSEPPRYDSVSKEVRDGLDVLFKKI